MSTRYVWDKKNLIVEHEDTIEMYKSQALSPGLGNFVVGEGYKETSAGRFELTAASPDIIPDPEVGHIESTGYPATKWKFAMQNGIANVIYEAVDQDSSDRWWLFRNGETGMTLYVGEDSDYLNPTAKTRRTLRSFTESAGSTIGTVSSDSYGKYPSNGKQGGYWYKYRGADSIDPSEIQYSYNGEELETGSAITITITNLNDPPYYGGTVFYNYQYSIDGGNTWINAGKATTETCKTVTIPEGAEQFCARVHTSDGWGFISTWYVTGENLPVSQMKAYATVGGKLRAGVKLYATVGGKIRRIQKGYATAGGKIRKMF